MSCQIDYIKYTQCVTCYHHDNIWHMHIVDTHTHTYVCTYICMYMHCVGRYQTLDDPPKHLNRLSPIWEKSTNAIMVLVTSKNSLKPCKISQQLYMLRQIVCTILFSSRWQVFQYKLFSVLSALQKWQNFDETSSL